MYFWIAPDTISDDGDLVIQEESDGKPLTIFIVLADLVTYNESSDILLPNHEVMNSAAFNFKTLP